MLNIPTSRVLKYFAILGNIIFIFWILYNGIDDGFKGSPIQVVVYIALISLLVMNAMLIFLSLQNGK